METTLVVKVRISADNGVTQIPAHQVFDALFKPQYRAKASWNSVKMVSVEAAWGHCAVDINGSESHDSSIGP